VKCNSSLWAVRAWPCERRVVVEREHFVAQASSQARSTTHDLTLAGGSSPRRRAKAELACGEAQCT
jgi:hypothetical protein